MQILVKVFKINLFFIIFFVFSTNSYAQKQKTLFSLFADIKEKNKVSKEKKNHKEEIALKKKELYKRRQINREKRQTALIARRQLMQKKKQQIALQKAIERKKYLEAIRGIKNNNKAKQEDFQYPKQTGNSYAPYLRNTKKPTTLSSYGLEIISKTIKYGSDESFSVAEGGVVKIDSNEIQPTELLGFGIFYERPITKNSSLISKIKYFTGDKENSNTGIYWLSTGGTNLGELQTKTKLEIIEVDISLKHQIFKNSIDGLFLLVIAGYSQFDYEIEYLANGIVQDSTEKTKRAPHLGYGLIFKLSFIKDIDVFVSAKYISYINLDGIKDGINFGLNLDLKF